MSAVAMRPYNTFGSTEASTSYSSNVFNNSNNNSDNNSSTGKRNGATSARKRAERFLHEKAPGVSTLVAGHPEGLLSSSSTNDNRVGRLGLPLKSSSYRHGKNGKRYSKNEVAGLVPDIDGGDELHDPEYEAIKLVERPPPPLTTHSSSNNNDNNRSSTITYNNDRNGTSNDINGVQHKSKHDDGDDNDEDSDTTASVVSSTEDEEENGMEAFSPKNRAANLQATPFGSSSTNLDSRRSKPRKTGPSRSYRNYAATSAAELHDPASASAAALSSASSPYLNARHSNAVIAGVGSSTTSSGRLGQNLRSYATTSGTGGSTNFLRPPSVNTHSTGRSSSRRTFADGPATYLAPSITMPPIIAPMGEARPEGYNPYTYIPTTAAPSDVLSHHHSLPFQHSKRHVDFGPSTVYTYEKDKEQERIAPPIAWQSSFTPSADHPERHKTKIHDDTPISAANLKRSIQSIKLDITFGLMKLGKKK